MLPPDPSGEPMCEECVKLENKIAHYQRFLKQRYDPLTEERIKQAVQELEQQKASLH